MVENVIIKHVMELYYLGAIITSYVHVGRNECASNGKYQNGREHEWLCMGK